MAHKEGSMNGFLDTQQGVLQFGRFGTGCSEVYSFLFP